jgi:hypothetical protein
MKTDYRELESEAQVAERCPLCLGIVGEYGDCFCAETNGNQKEYEGDEP